MTFVAQLAGTAIGVTVATLGGFVVYGVLKASMGIRLDAEDEYNGADIAIHQITAYPQEDTRA